MVCAVEDRDSMHYGARGKCPSQSLLIPVYWASVARRQSGEQKTLTRETLATCPAEDQYQGVENNQKSTWV